jgi:hypothetical protein
MTLRGAAEQVIRVFEATLSITIIVVLSLAPATAAIAAGWVFARDTIPVVLLAAAGLGATGVFGIGLYRNRRRDRSRPEGSSHDNAKDSKAAGNSPLEQLTNAMVSFHDFNPQRRRFDHW